MMPQMTSVSALRASSDVKMNAHRYNHKSVFEPFKRKLKKADGTNRYNETDAVRESIFDDAYHFMCKEYVAYTEIKRRTDYNYVQLLGMNE
jgi:hypothetical protein